MKTKWTQLDMAHAVRAVREDKIPLLRAAKLFKVPRNTLRYRIDNGIPLEELKYIQRGPVTALSRTDEESLANYVVYLAKHGFTLRKSVINELALAMAKKEGTHGKFSKNATPGKQWWCGFRQRHPEVKLWKSRRSLPKTQATVTLKNKVKRHFKTLKDILDEYDVKDQKRRIFNCGESGVEVDLASRPRSRGRRQEKETKDVESKEHIGIQFCVTASGGALPPMIIFKGKHPPKGSCVRGGPDGTLYVSSETGFLNAKLYMLWFKEIFLKYVAYHPVVLIQEGTSCHLTPEMVECAQENNIALYCIPMGTSRALQPLEASVMGPLTTQLQDAVSKLRQLGNEPNATITRYNFASFFREPFNNAMSKHIIKKGFRKTGICPWDPDRIAVEEVGEQREVICYKKPTAAEGEASSKSGVMPEVCPVSITDVPEPIRGADNQIIEMVVTAEDTPPEDVIVDQVIDMPVHMSAISVKVEVQNTEEHSISSDDLDDFLAEDEDLSDSDVEFLDEKPLTVVIE